MNIIGVDLVFVIDDSGSIMDRNPNGFDLIKHFVAGISDILDIGLQRGLVGVILFSHTAIIPFGVTQHIDKTSLMSAIDSLPYRGGATNTEAALDLLRTAGQPGGALNLRNDSTHIAVLITDGASTSPLATSTATSALHESEIYNQVYVIGVTDAVDPDELNAIASNPSLVFNCVDFESLVILVEAVALQVMSG